MKFGGLGLLFLAGMVTACGRVSFDRIQDAAGPDGALTDAAVDGSPSDASDLDAGLDGALDAADAGDAAGDASVRPNRVFVTSTLVVPFDTSRADADMLCNSLAQTAGLPGRFVAWYARGGSAAVPLVGSSGWARMDGLAIAQSVGDLTSGRILRPVAFDENGLDVRDDGTEVVTASTIVGSVPSDSGDTCDTFSDRDGMVMMGSTAATTGRMFVSRPRPCTQLSRLFCFEVDRNVTLPPESGSGRLAFLSDELFTPGPGLMEADALCNRNALAAGLAGPFVAVLATDSASASSRLSFSTEPWVRPDGVAVGTLTDVMAGNLDAPVNVSAAGSYFEADSWTGATAAGAVGDATCGNWTSTTGDGRRGLASHSRAFFSQFINRTCSASSPIYCFEP